MSNKYDHIIAVDPGRKSGVAVWVVVDGAWILDSIEEYDSHSQADVAAMYQTIEYIRHDSGALAIIENQYLGSHKNFKSIRALVEVAGYWKYLCRMFMVECVEIMPAQWQKVLHVRRCRMNRIQLKRMAQEQCVAAHGVHAKTWGENICDAVCIGQYVVDLVKVDGLREIMQSRKGDDNECI